MQGSANENEPNKPAKAYVTQSYLDLVLGTQRPIKPIAKNRASEKCFDPQCSRFGPQCGACSNGTRPARRKRRALEENYDASHQDADYPSQHSNSPPGSVLR